MIVACQWKRSSPTGPALRFRRVWGGGWKIVRARKSRREAFFPFNLQKRPPPRPPPLSLRPPSHSWCAPLRAWRALSSWNRCNRSSPAVGRGVPLQVLQLCLVGVHTGWCVCVCMLRSFFARLLLLSLSLCLRLPSLSPPIPPSSKSAMLTLHNPLGSHGWSRGCAAAAAANEKR